MLSISPDLIRDRKAGLIDKVVHGKGVTGKTVYLDGPEYDPYDIQELTAAAVINKTNNYTRLRLGIWDGASFHALEEEVGPVKDEIYFSPNDIIIRMGARVRAELTGTVTGDDLEMTINGVWLNMER